LRRAATVTAAPHDAQSRAKSAFAALHALPDVVVNNAGIAEGGAAIDVDIATFDRPCLRRTGGEEIAHQGVELLLAPRRHRDGAAQGDALPDVVVNNAGIAEGGAAIDVDIATFDRVIDTNPSGAPAARRSRTRASSFSLRRAATVTAAPHDAQTWWSTMPASPRAGRRSTSTSRPSTG
jgi:NAD(P)-dependent dehydrogenase (short-subunit alcohol dehydrogenase family)